jgi:threonine dehydratase
VSRSGPDPDGDRETDRDPEPDPDRDPDRSGLGDPTLAEVLAIVRSAVPETPQFAWPLLGAAVGTEVWVKHEQCTPTGAFKVRGGLVYVERLRRRDPHVAGLISATRGNHGQSIAFAGARAGLPVTIVVPTNNSTEKNASMVGFGAELIVHGDDFQAAREFAADVAAERGLHMVPSYHPDLVAGVSTYAHELFAAAGELDAVYVPIGLGSGISGVLAARDALGLGTAVVGVVSERADAYARSVESGQLVSTESADTIIDGVACRVPDPQAFAVIAAGVSHLVRISDDESAAAMRLMFRTTHHLPCPSGAASLAGLWQERHRWPGRRVGVIMTSSNVDTDVAAQVLAGTTPST